MNAPNELKFPPLQDPTLFRTQSYLNGEWIDADSGLRFNVDNPADSSAVFLRRHNLARYPRRYYRPDCPR